MLIRRFEGRDQAAAKALILDGLGEHFGAVRYDLDPDLGDIRATYLDVPDADFLFVERGGDIVGTTGLVFERPGEARMVRVSTRRELRRTGIARRLLAAVEAECRARSVDVLWTFTQPEWLDAVAFHAANGLAVAGQDDVDVHLRRELRPAVSSS